MVNGRDETEQERSDRNFVELLQELRVAQTGVQILFGFLLTLPFAARADKIRGLDQVIYVATLIAAVTTMILLIAPVSQHRLLFRRGQKRELVDLASRATLAGLLALMVTVLGAVFVVLDVVIGRSWASGLVAVAATCQVGLWYVVPVLTRRKRQISLESGRSTAHERRRAG
jgi:hypothetical protein